MTVYQLNYSSEDYSKDYGIFSSKKKAELAKEEIILNSDIEMQDFYKREIRIYEVVLDKYSTNH